MQLVRRNLKRIDIYSPETEDSGYIGKKLKPKLLGYVNAEVQVDEETSEERAEGFSVYTTARLYMRPDAGVKCGDLAAVFSDKPDCRVTAVFSGKGYLMAKVKRI